MKISELWVVMLLMEKWVFNGGNRNNLWFVLLSTSIRNYILWVSEVLDMDIWILLLSLIFVIKSVGA
jgi:hypothetical protein